MRGPARLDWLSQALDTALATGHPGPLEAAMLATSGLPGPRLNLALVAAFADLVGERVLAKGGSVAGLEGLLDGWAARSPADAPGDQPAVILPCAAVVAYGQAGASRPEWWEDEVAKLQRSAADARWRVREAVAFGLQRLLAADWDRTVELLCTWAADPDALVARAAVVAVAEPPLLRAADRAAAASAVVRAAVANLGQRPPAERRDERVRVLRQALGFAPSVVAAAAGDLSVLEALVLADDPDLRWAARQNLSKARLRPWAAEVARLRSRLDA